MDVSMMWMRLSKHSILKDKAKFGSWLRVITLNLCKMWLRKSVGRVSELDKLMSRYETRPTNNEDNIDSSLVTYITPEDICINKEFKETLFTALSALPPQNQVVITLFYLDDLSYKEIGDFLNIPVSTVQSRLQKARKQLKEEFLKMAKEIFQDNRLGPTFTQKVLDEIMTEGRKHLFAMEWSEAEAAFLKAIEMKPNHAEAHFYVGYVKENQEIYKEAAKWYQKAAELKPDYVRRITIDHGDDMTKHGYPITRPEIDICPISWETRGVTTAWGFVAPSIGAEAIVCDYDAPEWRLSYRREYCVIEAPEGDVGTLLTQIRTFDSKGKLQEQGLGVWELGLETIERGVDSGSLVSSGRPRNLEVGHQYKVVEEWLTKGEKYRHNILLEVQGVYSVNIGSREYVCILALAETRGRGHGEPTGQATRRTLVQYYLDISDGTIVLFRRFDGPGYYDLSRLTGSSEIVRGDILYRHRYDCVRVL